MNSDDSHQFARQKTDLKPASKVQPQDKRVQIYQPTKKGWSRPNDTITGYTGFYQTKQDKHVLDVPLKKHMIRGYSGFVPQTRFVCGAPAIPSLSAQSSSPKRVSMNAPHVIRRDRGPIQVIYDDEEEDEGKWIHFGYGMDLIERYEVAVERLKARGQSQEFLLKLVQAKVSERVHSYAEQLISIKNTFQAFDKDENGILDENEFRECLERCNVQLDDVQLVALFAYFDRNVQGKIEYEDFANNCVVFNPKGGTAVLPKQIIATQEKHGKYERANKTPSAHHPSFSALSKNSEINEN